MSALFSVMSRFYLENSVVTERLHAAVYNNFAAILSDMAQLAGPVTLIP
jgi:hypothetical protein